MSLETEIVALAQAIGADIKALGGAPHVQMAFADNLDIGAAASDVVIITGQGTLTGFAPADAGITRTLFFGASASDSVAITHNNTSMQLPGMANIITRSGESAEFLSLGGGNWKCLSYTPCRAVGVKFESGQSTPVVRGPMAGYQSAAPTSANATLALRFPAHGTTSVKTVRIRGFEYADGFGAWEVLVAGRNNGAAGWTLTSADLICGNPPFNSVRFSDDGTFSYVLLGDLSMTGHYPMSAVMDMTTSWNGNQASGWNDDYFFVLLSDESAHTVGSTHYLRRTNAVTQAVDFGTAGGAGWGEPQVVTVAAPWVKADTLLSVISIEAIAPNDQEEVEGQELSGSIVGPIVPGVSFTLTLSSRSIEGFGAFNVTVQGINP